MKYSSKASLFWALVAGQSLSCSAFAPSGIGFPSNHPSQHVHAAATLENIDQQRVLVSLESPVKSRSDVSIPNLEELTAIVLDEETYPTLPKEVVGSAYEVLFQWGMLETVEGARMVEKLIQRFEKKNPEILNNRHYTVEAEAWTKSGHANGAERAEKVLLKMEKIAKTINPLSAPTRATFSTVASAHAKQGDAAKAYSILRRMEKIPNMRPTSFDYKNVLSAFAREGDARKAEKVLKRMVDLTNDGYSEYAPDISSYRMVMDSWARSKETGSGKRAREILQGLRSRADEGEIALEPDARTFTSAIHAVVRSGDGDSVEQVQGLFDQALSRGIVPDAYLYITMMQAYANVGAVEKTEEILQQMEDSGIVAAPGYNTVIKAWKSSNLPDAPERAERCLERMTSLNLADTIGYTTVMSAYANRGDTAAAERVESLLQQMQDLHREGNHAVKPNVNAFNAVLHCWVQCGDVVRAEVLLNRMEKLYQEGETDICPNVVSYSTVINGWWKSNEKDGPARAERLFKRMVDMYKAGNESARPNLVSYVSVLNAIIRSGESDCAQRAEDVLMEMYEQYTAGNSDVKPNARVIALVIESWQKSGNREAGEKAEALLGWMIDIYNEHKDRDFQPNEYICSLAISAWSKSRSFGKAARARGILQKMKVLHESGTIAAPPNTHCYTAVINSCAFSMNEPTEKRAALEIALATYKELERTPAHGKPNHVTYATMIIALTNLLPQTNARAAGISSVFKKCCDRGQVDELVIRRLQGALSLAQLKLACPDCQLTKDGLIDPASMPREWRKNV